MQEPLLGGAIPQGEATIIEKQRVGKFPAKKEFINTLVSKSEENILRKLREAAVKFESATNVVDCMEIYSDCVVVALQNTWKECRPVDLNNSERREYNKFMNEAVNNIVSTLTSEHSSIKPIITALRGEGIGAEEISQFNGPNIQDLIYAKRDFAIDKTKKRISSDGIKEYATLLTSMEKRQEEVFAKFSDIRKILVNANPSDRPAAQTAMRNFYNSLSLGQKLEEIETLLKAMFFYMPFTKEQGVSKMMGYCRRTCIDIYRGYLLLSALPLTPTEYELQLSEDVTLDAKEELAAKMRNRLLERTKKILGKDNPQNKDFFEYFNPSTEKDTKELDQNTIRVTEKDSDGSSFLDTYIDTRMYLRGLERIYCNGPASEYIYSPNNPIVRASPSTGEPASVFGMPIDRFKVAETKDLIKLIIDKIKHDAIYSRIARGRLAYFYPALQRAAKDGKVSELYKRFRPEELFALAAIHDIQNAINPIEQQEFSPVFRLALDGKSTRDRTAVDNDLEQALRIETNPDVLMAFAKAADIDQED